MRVLVESFRRLYRSGKITLDQLKGYVSSGKITTGEYDYIVGIGGE